jgi:hypothetical protein
MPIRLLPLHFYADLDPCFQIKTQNLEKLPKYSNRLIFHTFCYLQIDADPDPDLAYHFDADPDPADHFYPDPDLTPFNYMRIHQDPDADPQHCIHQ